MKASTNQSLFSRACQRLKSFPRKHLLTLSILSAALVTTMSMSSPNTGEPQLEGQPIQLSLSPEVEEMLPEIATPAPAISATSAVEVPVTEAAALPTQEEVPAVTWRTETVRTGDSLSLIFQRAGLSDRLLHDFMASNPATKSLKRIHPGHELEFQIEDGRLQALRYRHNRMQSELFTRVGDKKFEHKTEARKPDIQTAYREAEITSSLFVAGQKAGLNADMIMELANIFGWDIDFGLDIRKGDHFKVLYEEKYLDGVKIGNGDILAAEFTNQQVTYRAVRYTDKEGETHYFAEDGRSMRKAFLRAPLDFRRISSNFNPQRMHPILKTLRPHRGIDYSAPRGTPVWSPGNGRVTQSGFTHANGNFVVIQHGNGVETKYLHLDKRMVKVGDRVKQKQVIGTVGSTGYSTGPHLHYEFLLDGIHRNPRTILEKLPKNVSIAKSEMPRFREAAQPLLAVLDSHHQQMMLAKAGHE